MGVKFVCLWKFLSLMPAIKVIVRDHGLVTAHVVNFDNVISLFVNVPFKLK
jgi:hypothetical protein